jgi:hypothetical protein
LGLLGVESGILSLTSDPQIVALSSDTLQSPHLKDLREAFHGAQLLWTSATVYKLECVSLFVQTERAEVLLSCCVVVQTGSTCPLLSAQRKPLEGAATT